MVSNNDPINVPWSVTDMVIGAALVIASLLGFLLLFRLFSSSGDQGLGGVAAIWLTAASEGVLVYVVWRLAVKRYGVGWDALGLRRPGTRHNVVLVVATLSGSLILTGVYAALAKQLGIDVLIPDQLPEEFWGGGTGQRLLTTVAIAGWIPFVEEVFFRGFLFQGLASRYGVTWGAVVSAAVFAVSHLVIGSMVPIFITGLMFAALYTKTRSLWIPMSAHAAQNLLALLVSASW